MHNHELMALALGPTTAVVRAITPAQQDLSTPCDAFTVRDLLAHFHESSAFLIAAAGAGEPPAGLLDRLAVVGAAYAKPSAWEGEVTLPSGPMPAAMIAGMAVAEVVVHGWDLAAAIGQHPQWDPELIEFLYSDVAKTAELGRQMGAYGPAVEVPGDAPLLDRMLGLTGRSPRFSGAAA
ncbi:TIGR03086 family metal-binding protein [Actinoplanes sp. TFC3]|uniref:TIGR03086 family metal-binding protein n=1 Tax=Actinoplanes sp. TFC3 TaxID=1710355 RepID=UPI000831DA4D|nr:TIGR03086 family metal-binding protein [Actinoplanes sp. TFC3]